MIKNIEVTEKAEGISEVKALIDKDVAKDYYAKASQKITSNAKIKGYRPGKAPAQFVQKIYDPQIKYETINALFPSIYEKIEKEHQIRAISTPDIAGFEEFVLGEDLLLTITIETAPFVREMKDLDTVSIRKIEYSYNEEEMIQKELEVLQGLHAHYHDLEGKVNDGDFAKVTFTIKGEGIERPTASRFFMIKKEDPQYSLSSHFKEKELGQTYHEKVDFSADFPDEELKGKSFEVEFTIEEGRTVHQPEIDDELAKKFAHDSLEELKNGIKLILQKRAQMRGLYDSADLVYEALSQTATFSISEKVVVNQTQSELQQLLQKIMRYQSMENYLKEKGLSQENFIDDVKKNARHSIEKYLISHALLDQFKIDSNKKELDDFIGEIAGQEVANKKEIIEYYNKNEDKKESLKEQLDMKKLAEVVLEKVKITGTDKKDLKNASEEA